MQEIKGLQWRANTGQLLAEVMQNPGTSALHMPLKIFSSILLEVAQRASELNDPQLNQLMLRLALYEQGDPYHANYTPDAFDKPKRVPAPRMVQVKCRGCGEPFMARVVDRKRGWAKCCSKSCAAKVR